MVRKKMPHVAVAALCESKAGEWTDASRDERKSLKMCDRNVRKPVEASLDIKDVIYQSSQRPY